jgi:hypothetical protein
VFQFLSTPHGKLPELPDGAYFPAKQGVSLRQFAQEATAGGCLELTVRQFQNPRRRDAICAASARTNLRADGTRGSGTEHRGDRRSAPRVIARLQTCEKSRLASRYGRMRKRTAVAGTVIHFPPAPSLRRVRQLTLFHLIRDSNPETPCPAVPHPPRPSATNCCSVA